MTIPHTVSIGDIPVSAWANGRGETVELARRPATGLFAWRLSMATISEAAAFSPLPGVARVLLAVDGPLTLTIDGETHELARHGTASFSGDQDAAASAPAAPQRDLNLMVRGGGVPSLEVVKVDGRVATTPDVVAVVVLEGEVTALGQRLVPGDTVVTAGDEAALRGSGVVAFAAIR